MSITVDERDLKNGANLVVVNDKDEILVVREKSRKQLLMLPGGEVERGESPRHAAQSETEEEAGIVTDEAHFRLIAIFVQKPKGFVILYETRRWSGEITVEHSDDTSEAFFISIDEIVRRQEEFRTGSLRMILRYIRCVRGIDQIPYEGRLSDPVELLKDPGAKYSEVVLLV